MGPSTDDDHEEEGFTPEAKPSWTVAKRFALLLLVTELADSVLFENAGAREDGIAMRRRALDQLVALGFTPHDLESAEQQLARGLHSGQVGGPAVTAAMWRVEGAPVLAWALGLRNAILPVNEAAEPAALRSELPTSAGEFAAFCEGAAVRPLGELLAARHDWTMKFFSVEHQSPSEERSRILERFRALRWLTEPDQTELSSTPVLENATLGSFPAQDVSWRPPFHIVYPPQKPWWKFW